MTVLRAGIVHVLRPRSQVYTQNIYPKVVFSRTIPESQSVGTMVTPCKFWGGGGESHAHLFLDFWPNGDGNRWAAKSSMVSEIFIYDFDRVVSILTEK